MGQPTTRAILIPVVATILAVIFWGLIANTGTQAHAVSTLASGAPRIEVLSNQREGRVDAVENRSVPSLPQSQAAVTYTLQPLPYQKARQLLEAQRTAKHIANGTQDASTPSITQDAAISFLKTVVLSAGACQDSIAHELVVPPTTTVTYCYIVFNTGTVTLTSHTVVDAQNAFAVNDLLYELTPAGTERSAAFFSVSRFVTQTITSSATWIAKSSNTTVNASDQTRVIVPTIEMNSTVVANSKKCGHEKSLRVASNTPLLYCYRLKNTSPITLPLQTLVDSTIGTLLENQALPLPAGALLTITYAVIAVQSSTSVVTWTSATTNHVKVMTSDLMTVQVPASIQLTASASLTNDACNKSSSLTVKAGSTVIFCYLIRNNGGTTLTHHQIQDSLDSGHIPFTKTVGVNQLLAVTVPKVITQTISNIITWTAHNQEGATAVDSAVVHVTVLPSVTTAIFVYYDVNHNISFDSLEMGLSDVLITITSASGLILAMRTNDTGMITFTGLSELGSYTVTVDPTSLPPNYTPSELYETITVTDRRQGPIHLGYTSPDTTDYDTDDIPDILEGPEDFDKDGIANYQDSDSDNDGLPDSVEGIIDLDNDGKPDFLDPNGEPNVNTLYLPTISR